MKKPIFLIFISFLFLVSCNTPNNSKVSTTEQSDIANVIDCDKLMSVLTIAYDSVTNSKDADIRLTAKRIAVEAVDFVLQDSTNRFSQEDLSKVIDLSINIIQHWNIEPENGYVTFDNDIVYGPEDYFSLILIFDSLGNIVRAGAYYPSEAYTNFFIRFSYGDLDGLEDGENIFITSHKRLEDCVALPLSEEYVQQMFNYNTMYMGYSDESGEIAVNRTSSLSNLQEQYHQYFKHDFQVKSFTHSVLP